MHSTWQKLFFVVYKSHRQHPWQPPHNVRQSRSQWLFVEHAVENNSFHAEKRSETACKTFLLYPDSTYCFWQVLNLIPSLLTPADINMMLHVCGHTCTCKDFAAYSNSSCVCNSHLSAYPLHNPKTFLFSLSILSPSSSLAFFPHKVLLQLTASLLPYFWAPVCIIYQQALLLRRGKLLWQHRCLQRYTQ